MRRLAPLVLSVLPIAVAVWALAHAPAPMPEHRRVPLLPDLPAPVAARIPHTEVLHGEARSDDYAWLRNPDDPAVRGYLEAENEYADAVLDSTRTLQERLYQEMVARIPEVERSLPEADDQADYFWVKRREDEHGSYVRRLRADGTEQTLLDLEAAGRGHAYAAVLRDSVSPDGRWWAWVIDTCGDEAGTLRVKDLATGDVLPDAIERVERFDWGKGAPDLLYVQRAGRWNRLFRHRLDGSPDTLLFQHEDWFFFSETADRLSIGIRVRHGTWDWRVHHLEATDAEAQANEWRDVRTDASVRGASFFDTDSFQDHTVQYRRERGRCALQVKRDNIRLRTIEFPEPVYDLHPLRPRPGPRARLDSYRFVLESFTTPPRCYEYDPGTEDLALIQSMDVPGCDGSRYQTRYLEVSSTEGARIPVSLAYLGTSPLHRRPVLLQAYGAYGASFPPSFDAGRLSLLDRGVVLAIAGVRGGGERGESWYRAGQGPRKRTSVQDLIAVARNLIDRGTTAPDRLALASGSAGGFLITAAANERPDLFQVVLADVPMTDLLAGLRDLPGSHEEWGDPAVEEEFRSLRELCPTANVKPQAYPAMLLRTAWLDSRVPCWAAARYVARLRAVKCDPNPVLLVTRWSGGHLGPSRRTDRLREEAQQFAFLLHRFGIDE